jgi:NAD(P)-dependent dehydrogenase (short-subunit alcohol dehydrogenase family)
MILRMRVALVTGAAHGIGAAVTARLLQEGWHVVAADHAGAQLAGLPRHPALRVAACDVADPHAVSVLLEGIAGREARLDALVSNAGFMIRKPLAELTHAEFSSVIATNLTACFLLVRAGERLLRAARGAVVTIASTRAHMSEPDTESYAASKGGLVALTHALAISLGPDVRVNAVSPGWIDVAGDALSPEDHAQHPAGRVGRAQDVASMVAWLLAPEQGFVTGAEFVIDGGMTRKMIYAE